MAELLYVGDPHATVAELGDMEALLDFIVSIVQKRKPDGVVFLGDQYHNHGLVHLEVMAFWIKAIKALSSLTRVFLMVGNHDKPGNGRNDIHALMVHEGQGPNVKVIDRPMVFEDIPGVVFIPHTDKYEDFLAACNHFRDHPVLVCHQTFNGGRYENGFYAKDGLDPNLVPQDMILSGHIHAPQQFGKVCYIGAPRWRIATDTNTDRHLHLMRHQDHGLPMQLVEKFDTGAVCRRIIDLEAEESDTLRGFPFFSDQYDTKKDSVTVTLRGSAEYLKANVPLYERKGFKVRTVKTGGTTAPRVRESEGVSTAFQKFVAAYKGKHGTPVAILTKLAGERLAHA